MEFSGGSDLEAVSVAHIPDLARITHIFLQFSFDFDAVIC